ncbi:unnamed protein product, partial [Sphacelaria rigidula]
MEDVQKALRELGLNRDEVTLEKLSELEWKLGEIKFGLDDVDAAGVLLGAMHFNAPLSPSTGQTNGNGGMRFASATPLPSKHVRSSSSCSSSSACSYSPGRDMPGARDGGEATAAAEGAETTNSNGTGTTPGTSNA